MRKGYKDVSTESKQTSTSTVAQQTVPIGRHVWCVGIEMFEGGLQSEKDVEAEEGCQQYHPQSLCCQSCTSVPLVTELLRAHDKLSDTPHT